MDKIDNIVSSVVPESEEQGKHSSTWVPQLQKTVFLHMTYMKVYRRRINYFLGSSSTDEIQGPM
jgi:hypothetical protein